MRKTLLLPAVVALVTLICVAPLFAEDKSAAEPYTKLSSMSWLAGSWTGSMWGGTFEAYYSTPEGGRILSYSQLKRGGKVAFHEFEMFGPVGTDIVLVPHPGGRPKPAFKLTKLESNKAVFENPKKDFPTRITYHRVGDKALEITLDDPHSKSDKQEVFKLKRP